MSKKQTEPEYLIPPVFDEDGVQASSGIGKDGKEYPDPVPMAPPVGYDAPPDLMTLIRRMVRAEDLRRVQEQAGFETFEEADDFDIDDDPPDPVTPYERIFFPEDEKGLAVVPPVPDDNPAKQVKEPEVASPPAGSEASKAQSST